MSLQSYYDWRAIGSFLVLAASTSAAILPVHDMEQSGQAAVTASAWDMGHKDNLFDGDWQSLYRSAAINPALITIEFSSAQSVAAARGAFSNTQWYSWELEAADNVADLDGQSGSYVHIFGPTQVPGDLSIQWAEWNQTPVTRHVFRFTVERLTGDNYVHIRELELQTHELEETVTIEDDPVRINILEIDPDNQEIAIGTEVPFSAEASLCYGPDRYDVTDLATWTSTDPAVASITAGGLVMGVAEGQTVISADIGVVHGETPVTVHSPLPTDIDVGFIHRTPEYNRFKVSFDGDQHIHPDYVGEKKWPDPGEVVTYTAHIFNRGDQLLSSVVYRWYFDDQLVDEGTITSLEPQAQTTVSYAAPWPSDTVQTVAVPPGAMTLDPQQLERAIGDHRIRIEADPDDEIAETCELNNTVEDYINALTFWIFMDDTTYARFSEQPCFLESRSPEDWARGQLIGFERRLRVSGCPQRLRLDMVAVYRDGQLSGGGTHEPIGSETRQADGRWGFQIGEWTPEKIARYAKIVENPLCHEWGHQIGLIDIYQYDVSLANCLITYDGSLVAGTPLLPVFGSTGVWFGNFEVWHLNGICLYDSTWRAMMGDTSRRFLGRGSAAGMNRNLGLRRGFFGDYLGAIQQGQIKLRVEQFGGEPVPSCGIRVFPRDQATATVQDNPKFAGVTDAQGEWVFPDHTLPGWSGGMAVNNPWSWKEGAVVHHAPHAGGRNALLIAELEYDDRLEYHFVEVDDLNIAICAGETEDYTIVLTTYASIENNQRPVVTLNGTPEWNDLQEGELFTATVSAIVTGGAGVTLSATPLYGSTFNPRTGGFTFQPDALQVNVAGDYSEPLYVIFQANDGKMTGTKRFFFRVSDIPGFAYINENARAGDLNGDGTIDIADAIIFLNCLNGPNAQHAAGGELADMDEDGDADLADFAVFQVDFTGN